MKSKLKNVNIREATKYVYPAVLIVSLIMCGLLYFFVKKNVYDALVFDYGKISRERSISAENINMAKFEKIVSRLKSKAERNNIGKIRNIFAPGTTSGANESEAPGKINLNY